MNLTERYLGQQWKRNTLFYPIDLNNFKSAWGKFSDIVGHPNLEMRYATETVRSTARYSIPHSNLDAIVPSMWTD